MKFDNVLANELLMSGYTLPEVAKKLKLNYQQVVYNTSLFQIKISILKKKKKSR